MIIDGFFNDMVDLILLGIPLALILGGLLKYFHYTYHRKMEQLQNQIDELEEQVIVVTGSSVPGKKVTRVVGPVTGFSTVYSGEIGKFQQAEREAMLSLIRKALDQGANAVIDLKMNGPGELVEVSGPAPKVTYLGTAVVT